MHPQQITPIKQEVLPQQPMFQVPVYPALLPAIKK
jgi:hypothetical protein